MSEYVLGSDDAEIARLDGQAVALAGAGDALLRAAGIAPGMRVLDLGTGLGHVAFQLAEIVGPEGSVVGVDRQARMLAIADRRRTTDNVQFVKADVRTVRVDGPFDAIVSRLLVQHLTDPVEVLRGQQANLRPGGIMAAIDCDAGSVRAEPDVALVNQAIRWVEAAIRAARGDPRAGARLILLLRKAGFADVAGLGIQAYQPPGDPPGPAMLAGVIRTLEPAIVAGGIATKDEIGVDTLEERLLRDVEAAGAVFLPPTVAGAWGRLRS
jgi:SAM-dependent methyltransferase